MRTHLFAAVAGQVKRENREKRNPHAGNDDVHRVEEGLPPHRDVERDVQVRLVAAGVKLLVSAKKEAMPRTSPVNRRIDKARKERVELRAMK